MADSSDGTPRDQPVQGDVAVIVEPTPDRQGFHVLRRRDQDSPVELGTLRPLQEGKPLEGEVISLSPRKDAPMICDVKTEIDLRRPASAGPAQVATDSYRSGWDAIWGHDPAALN